MHDNTINVDSLVLTNLIRVLFVLDPITTATICGTRAIARALLRLTCLESVFSAVDLISAATICGLRAIATCLRCIHV